MYINDNNLLSFRGSRCLKRSKNKQELYISMIDLLLLNQIELGDKTMKISIVREPSQITFAFRGG